LVQGAAGGRLRKLGKYELLGELGRGAFGIVYRARDPIINRMVALKVMSNSVAENPDFLQRFYREAQSAGSLQHPNIITIYDMGNEDGTPFMAMELVEGQTLDDLISRRAQLPISVKLVYAVQACRAFDYAHKRGIIHRDIKPGNVMVNKEGTVKVVDFGIARVLETSKTQTGTLIGTFSYMAPEVFHGEHATERSDIWSFGVLLYELLAYQRPFHGDSPAALMQSICLHEPVPLAQVAPDCPEDLQSAVHRMLRKTEVERVQTMEDLLLELDPIRQRLQAETVAGMIERGRQLAEQGEFAEARELLRQALHVDPTNSQARGLSEKVGAELKRLSVQPKAQQHVDKGRALLHEGKLQEAKAEAENALHLDSRFQPAQALQQELEEEVRRAQLVNEWLHGAAQHLVEGLPEEAEALLAQVQQADPSNQQLPRLQQQVLEERTRRQKRMHFLEGIQQARLLWTRQQYQDCIDLLTELQPSFPGEDEIVRLLETTREDQAEQKKQEKLAEARTLLASRRWSDCISLLTKLREEFPTEDEIRRLLETAREDQAEQKKQEKLAEARSLLASRHYDDCIALLAKLREEFPDEDEVRRLLDAGREDQAEQEKQEKLAEARSLLASRRYSDCVSLLTKLREEFPKADEIRRLLEAAGEEQAEQHRQQQLTEVRKLLATRHYEECIALLTRLQQEFPGDDELARLLETAGQAQAEQSKRGKLAEARKLLAARRYEEGMALLTALQEEFGGESEIVRLLETARKDQAEQNKRKKLGEARKLLSARNYELCITLLNKLQQEMPQDDEVVRLLDTAREDQAEHDRKQKLVAAKDLLAGQRLSEALAILDPLLAAAPGDSAVLKLRALIQREQAKQARFETLQREWTVLKKLVSDKAYPEVVKHAENLLREFPGEADLMRLVEFARNQQSQTEHEQGLRAALDKAQGFLKTHRFAEAAAAARLGLVSFPGDTDLAILLEQAETWEKKEKVRQLIEQRVRDIRVKINRGQLSEAKKLARETLTTLGPDTDVHQLLTSAEVEYQAREKKKLQEQKLETVRTLVQSGRLDEATTTLDEVIKSGDFHALDPRLYQLADEIAAVRSGGTAQTLAAQPEPQSPKREYAILEGPPLPAEETSPTAVQPAPQQAPAIPVAPSSVPETVGGHDEHLRRLEKRLATFIGPVAKIIVKKAASRTTDPRELPAVIAESLEQEADRRAFLAGEVAGSQNRPQSQLPQERSQVSSKAPVANTWPAELTPAVIERAAGLLARYVGPISGVLVRRAAPRADSLRAFYLLLAEHVESKSERARFLQEAGVADS